jgi:hypothetical protein
MVLTARVALALALAAAAALGPASALGPSDHCRSACNGVNAPQDLEGKKQLGTRMREVCAEVQKSSAPELRVCHQFYDRAAVMACELACSLGRTANAVSTTREFGELRAQCEQYRGGSRGPKAMRACQLGVQGGLKMADKGLELRTSIEATCASDPTEKAQPDKAAAEPVKAAAAEPVKKATEPVKKATEPVNKATEPVMAAAEPVKMAAAEPVKMAAAEPVKKASEPVKKATEPVMAAEPVEAAQPVKAAEAAAPADVIAEMEAESNVVQEVIVPKKLRSSAA